MALTDLLLYTTINALKSKADDIDTKYSNVPYSCPLVAAKVTTIKALLDATWTAAVILLDGSARDSAFKSSNMCGLAGLALTDTDACMGKLMESAGNIGEAGFLTSHITGHLNYIYDNWVSCADTGTKLDHVATDLTQINTDIGNIETWFGTLDNLLLRINRGLGMIGASLGCASAIMDQMAGSDMRNVFSNLGIGSAQEDKEASVMSDVLAAVDTHKGETNLNTRFGLIKTDVITDDGWNTDMTSIKSGAATDFASLTNISPFP